MKVIFGHPLWQKHGLKFFRFAVCGGLGACVDFGSLYIFVHILGIPEKYAFVGSTGLAMIFVFFANRFFTFRASGSTGNQAIRFLAVYLVAGFLNYVLSLTFFTIGIHYMLSKALAIGFIMFFNYFFLNGFVFRQKTPVSDEVIVA